MQNEFHSPPNLHGIEGCPACGFSLTEIRANSVCTRCGFTRGCCSLE